MMLCLGGHYMCSRWPEWLKGLKKYRTKRNRHKTLWASWRMVRWGGNNYNNTIQLLTRPTSQVNQRREKRPYICHCFSMCLITDLIFYLTWFLKGIIYWTKLFSFLYNTKFSLNHCRNVRTSGLSWALVCTELAEFGFDWHRRSPAKWKFRQLILTRNCVELADQERNC